MKFCITPALIALAIPASAYTFGNFPDSLFSLSRAAACRPGERCGPASADVLMIPEDMMAMRHRRRRHRRNNVFKQAFQSNSPGYQIVDNQETFSVQVDVPGVKAEDLKINFEEDGKVLTLSGSRDRNKDGFSYSSHFSQSFSLDSTIDTDNLSANLQNGVLVVSAPRALKKLDEAVKSIPVTVLPSASVDIKSEATGVETEGEIPSVADSTSTPPSTSNEPKVPDDAETIDLDAPDTKEKA